MSGPSERKKRRQPKEKLSTLDELTGDGAEAILYRPRLSEQELKVIDEKTRLADVPLAARGKIHTSPLQVPRDSIPKQEAEIPKLTCREPNTNPDIPTQKTDNKEITNGYQTDNRTDNKEITNGYQTGSSFSAQKPKQITERITKQITIGQQTDNKQITNCGFETLVGHEKNLLLLIFRECLRTGSLTSPEMTLSFISQQLGSSSNTAKMIIHRLIKKGFTWRAQSKTGRGGWIKFGLEKQLYQDLRIRETDNKEISNGYQTDNKEITQRITEQITSPSSSSSYLNNTTTTQTNYYVSQESISELQDFKITASTITRAFDLYPNATGPDVEKLIPRFKEYMMRNQNRVQNARGFFLSLVKQLSNGMVPLDDIEPTEELLARKFIQEMETSKAEKVAVLQKAEELAFDDWHSNLNISDMDKLVPPNNVVSSGSETQRVMLKKYFSEQLWPKMKAVSSSC
jgi:predicted transcriptional regulator